MVILASFEQHPWMRSLAAITLTIGAAYTLWLVKRAIWGDVGNAHVAELKDMNPREAIVLGVSPPACCRSASRRPLTHLMEPFAQLASQLAATKL